MLRARPLTVALSLGLGAMLLMTAAVQIGAAAFGASPLPVPAAQQPHRTVAWGPQFQRNPTSFWVDSVSVGAPSSDQFQIDYSKGSFRLDYERSAGGPVTSSFTVTIEGIVEWIDAGDGVFSDGLVVGYTPMGAAAFGNLPIQHAQTTTSDGVRVDSFRIPSDSNEVILNLTISQGFVQMPSGTTLTPMEAELTVQVNHMMSRAEAHLALRLSLSTDERVSLENQSWDEEHRFSEDERAVNVTGNLNGEPSSTFFAWSNRASVNNQLGPVEVSGPELNETTGAYDLYLSYPHVSSPSGQVEVIHDPTIGVVSAAYESLIRGVTSGIQGDLTLYVVSMAAVAGLVAATAVLVARRRRERL